MRIALPIIFVAALFAASSYGQKRISELRPAHAAALEQFLSTNTRYEFLSESALEARYLRGMRGSITGGRPYYSVGDFNRDGIPDFAVVARRKGRPRDQGAEMAKTHRYAYPLAVLIFNGARGGKFGKPFIEDVEAPLACFIDTRIYRRKRQLHFGVFETDDIRIFTPAGKGYVVRYLEI